MFAAAPVSNAQRRKGTAAVNHARINSGAGHPFRTVVIHNRRWPSRLAHGFSEIVRRMLHLIPRPIKRTAKWIMQPRVLVPLGVVMLLFISTAAYYTVQYSHE